MDDERSFKAGDFDALLRGAQLDPDRQLGRLLQGFRSYLTATAESEFANRSQVRLDASDLAQMTFLEAFRDFRRFGGHSEAEFRAWLAQILRNNIRDVRANQEAQKRNPRREVSDPQVAAGLAADHSTPSVRAMRNEELAGLESALTRLSAEKLTLVRLRSEEGKSFKEIGSLLGISDNAVRKRWAGIIEELGEILRSDKENSTTPIQ